MDKVAFLLLICFYLCSAKITIKNLDVPTSISLHEKGVVLDCDYDSQGEDVDHVKWFHNNGSDRVIYQWILDKNKSTKPTIPKSYEDWIDVGDDKTMYRAIHLKKLSLDLSGNYTCVVSGPISEVRETKRMIIYDPANYGIELNITEDFVDPDKNITEADNLLAVSCYAEGVFPEPNITIYISTDNDTEEEAVIPKYRETIPEYDNETKSYNMSSIALYTKDELPSTFFYTCEMTIPGTDYHVNDTQPYFLESDNDMRTENEEDYTSLLNPTYTTPSSIEERQDIETQIEENKVNSVKSPSSSESNKDDDDTVKKEDTKNLKDNASLKQMSSLNLLCAVVLLPLLSCLL